MNPAPTPSNIEDTDDGWPTMLLDWARHQWIRFHRGVEPGEWPPGWAFPALAGTTLIITIAVIVELLIPFLRTAAGFLAATFDGGADWVRDWNIARVVLNPVRAYLDAHAAGLPISAGTLWWTWAGAGIALFLLGWWYTAVAARIGWVLYGTATAAMVYTATTGPSRSTAAGIAVLWWIALSLFALRRPRSSRVHAYLPQLPYLADLLRREPPAPADRPH